jgi:hypothetical protein
LDYFRRHPNGVLLALLALAAQIILPFGHTHIVAPRGEQALAHGVCVSGAPNNCTRPSGNHEHYCPLCAAMGAAGSLIIPAPVALTVLDLGGSGIPVPYWSSAEFGESPSAFQARAPPASLIS